MNTVIKQFIEENIDLIESNNFKELYNRKGETGVSELTQVLIKAGFDPLRYLTKVPVYYLQMTDGITKSDGTKQPFKQLNIPSNVYIVGSSAFYNCANLEEVMLPEGLQFIDDGAFAECYELSVVNLPSTLEYLAPDAFAETALREVIIPPYVRVLPRFCFEQCAKLTTLVLGDSVEVIGTKCFNLCSSLQNVKLNEGLRTIDSYAFKQCKSLKEIYIPETVTRIDRTAFELTDVTIQCKANSAAHIFAATNSYKYELI